MTFGGMRAPPRTVLPPLLAYVNRTDLDPSRQVRALAALAVIAPEDPRVAEAIEHFMPRAVDTETQGQALNAILHSRLSGSRICAVVANMLEGRRSGYVTDVANQTLDRMGCRQ
jgi:hypothetical protein